LPGSMIRAPRQSGIAGAGLDVLEKEPPDGREPRAIVNRDVLETATWRNRLLEFRKRWRCGMITTRECLLC
jgi:lactate dehydrogenase-like 2-hydroxyacid dehydrogenase